MKVQVIRPKRENLKKKSGIGYYADLIEKQLEELGYKAEVLDFELNLDLGSKNLFFNNIFHSIVKIIRGRKYTDVTHATAEHCSIFLPFTKARRIVTFHHVAKGNHAASKSWLLIWRISVMISKLYADEFIAISPLTKKDMIEKLNIPEDKITVVSHPPESNMFIENIIKEDIVLFVGTFTKRKNPKAALLVFKEMLEKSTFKGFKFIMCGAGPCKEKIDRIILEMDLGDSVKIINNLSVGELRNLYNKSKFLLNTSNFEGLGITTLEAQRCGTPVLYFKDAELPPEVMVAAISCADVQDMVEKASELLEDDALMTEVIERGIEFSNGFGKGHKEKLLEVYNKK